MNEFLKCRYKRQDEFYIEVSANAQTPMSGDDIYIGFDVFKLKIP